jgi:hypothetical protein
MEGMMYPSRYEDDCAGSDVKALRLSICGNSHFPPSAGNVVNLILGVWLLRVRGAAI